MYCVRILHIITKIYVYEYIMKTGIAQTLNIENFKFYALILLSMLFVTLKLTGNPLFFRYTIINIPYLNYSYKCTCTVFEFPIIYIISDIITVFAGRKFATKLVILGMLCDGLSSYFITTTENMFSNAEKILPFTYMWAFFYHGVVGSLIANIGELLIFSYLLKKLNSFLISTTLSSAVIIFIHNVITDYSVMKHDPEGVSIFLNNLLSEICIVFIYTATLVLVAKIIKIKYLLVKK